MSTAKSSQVDLQALAVDRSRRAGSREVRRSRHLFTRYVVPGVLLLGFAGLLAWTLRDRWLPATSVSVVPVTATRTMAMAADTPLFTSAGWIEPRPTPVLVSSLVEGVVERLTVIEGQEVAAGEPVAFLIDSDARLALRQAEADLALRQAERSRAEAVLKAARKLLEEPIPRLAELADAQAQLTKIETEIARFPAMCAGARARRDLASQEVESKRAAGMGVSAIVLRRAEGELAVAAALVEEYTDQLSALKRERDAVQARRDVLQRQAELKIDEQRAVAEAEAQVDAANAQIEQAAAAVDVARLRLERSVIRAPISGKILSLLARPGTKLMGLAPAAMADASTVVTMYDPASLQVRADVRLEDLPHVLIGQSVQIETPAANGPLTGKVVAITSVADIQKNTLQVKAAIDNPPPVIKPDMLVQVTFLAPPQAKPAAGEGEAVLRIGVPSALVEGTGDEARVWVADLAAGVARQRKIVLGRPISRELVEVTSGLAIGDRLIVAGRESLKDGTRIRVLQEDAAMGKGTADQPGRN
jgi:RND family efflux transporter MFP subunit